MKKSRDTHSKELLNLIAQAIYDKKGFNIIALDLHGISSLTDFVVIAEGNIDRHVKALALAVKNAMETQGIMPLFVEGEQSADWVVLDFSDIVIHLFVPEFREKYALEQLWKQAAIVDVKIDTSSNLKSKQS